jgi:hypothetical protein
MSEVDRPRVENDLGEVIRKRQDCCYCGIKLLVSLQSVLSCSVAAGRVLVVVAGE